MSFPSTIAQLNRRFCGWVCSQHWANRHEVSLLLITLLLFLRLPNLSEPYWYGDEGIYLTIGNALRHGLRLYRDIVDHKTPIIYWLAMTPSQMWFRTLLIVWMTAATVFFSHALRKLIDQKLAILASVLFVVFTSLPAFEGNIPNGELFVIGFISFALWLITKSQADTKRQNSLVFTAGVMSGLAVLTKVPAILDAAAIASLFWFWSLKDLKRIRLFLQPILVFSSGVILPIFVSILYFFLRGTANDYLQFGLLYNFRYSQSWSLPFDSQTLSMVFTLPGKTLVLLAAFGIGSAFVAIRKTTPLVAWSAFWVVATLFASLLSNRPYPHYLLQVAPPLALSLALFFDPKGKVWGKVLAVVSWLLVIGALLLLEFRPYPLFEYYYKFWNYSAGKISREQYVGSFDQTTLQNERLATTIRNGSLPNDRLFIWGTNPTLYALTERVPATRFTVSFHIHDFKAYESTMEEVRQTKPMFIVVMKQEPALAGLEEYIQENYFLAETTADMLLFRRFNAKSQLLLQ